MVITQILHGLNLQKVLPPQRFSHKVVVTPLCMACYVCACYDTVHPNMWPYDAKTVRIFITGKCCNPFSDPPALCTELATGSSHGLRGVNKNSGILRSPMPLFVQNKVPCVFHYVTDKRTSVRNMPAVSKTYYHSTYIFFFTL